MKLTNSLLALGLAALPASALAPAFSPFSPKGDEGKGADDATALVQKLGDKDYKVRRDAFKKLEARGAEARAALEAAAKGDDAEIRWNASRLLDRLDDDSAADAKPRRAAPRETIKSGSGELKERDDGGEADDGSDDDANANRPGRWRTLRIPHDFDTQSLEQQMRELERHMEDFGKQFDGSGNLFHTSPFGFRLFDGSLPGFDHGEGVLQLGPGSSFSRSLDNDGKTESLTIRVDANGRVTAEQTKDGKTETFEADSVEALQKEHPGLLGTGSMKLAIRPFGQFRRSMQDGQEAQPTPDLKARRKVKTKAPVATKSQVKVETQPIEPKEDAPQSPPAKPKLGIELAPLAPEVADYLDVEGDVLQIVRVVDDMPGARRGLKARDVLLEVNGKAVHQFEDVVKALEGADPESVPLVVLRRGQKKQL